MGFTGYKVNLEGLTFGRFEVIKRVPMPNPKDTNRVWLSRCTTCGQERVLTNVVLQKQAEKETPCNCYLVGRRQNPVEYRLSQIFNGLKQRCYTKTDTGYKNYGGKGITVCDEWLKHPRLFYDWCIANSWERGLQIDRKDNNGPYSPENCRFVTATVNMNNRSISVYLEILGERMTVTQATRKYNPFISPALALSRVKKGWIPEMAVLLPPIKHCSKRKQREILKLCKWPKANETLQESKRCP